MNSKKITIILIAVAFFIAAVFSCYLLFTISEVRAEFSVSDDIPVQEIKDRLDELKGKSVVKFNENEVYEIVSDYPLLKVESLQLKKPNLLLVKITERIPVYKIEANGEIYLLDDEGVAVSSGQGEYSDREVILLTLQGITVTEEIILGEKIVTDKDDILYNAFKMAKEVNLTDCIKQITVNYLSAGENRDVVFSTYTGVDITITKSDEQGIVKVKKAFESYDSCTTDYLKSYNRILVVMLDSGEISVTWTRN